ncbi:[citrate (pro-3S)-lyase] ligase [Enterococcus sp. BWB1-3]|uniref:[citrate (pro-3S)-lyase] ligase n=1 Tax=unclassified Enterococcus TaxID=2608891 RepID=UPI0019205BA6|nr:MULTISPECIES: [citrate (pro-3S)-lyase] ligase [unclassified Enterococcus]MBL1230969.1 [citrate (pro-3S)-lyase] ligase [Enterococcus sp. BWB1-3]MCB5953294.1 [citrate (pro-3S)-lyase] ligase [Enterococcus sp. BWT-B8]MCB5955738.1 [citrate (pro-3S)-lyase] ligase [Enterococcus sp. CWB-B31]
MYVIKRLWLKKDKKTYEQWANLMNKANLNKDEELDYTVGIYIDDTLAATGSYYHNILKCLVVCKDYQEENLLTEIVQHLINRLSEEGEHHYFVYTKPSNKPVFRSLGFQTIIETADILFMEQGFPDFQSYLLMLKKHKKTGSGSGIVMNANPFTKGHQYLIEMASKQSNQVYVFVLSEDRSEFSSQDRLEMVKQGVAHLTNVTVLPTNDYLVSSATFPSYFLKDDAVESVARMQAAVDAQLFKEKIAPVLDIQTRFVGEEPYSKVTDIYNQSMKAVFDGSLELVVLPRLSVNGEIISATKVREALHTHDSKRLIEFLPPPTDSYIKKQKNTRGERT